MLWSYAHTREQVLSSFGQQTESEGCINPSWLKKGHGVHLIIPDMDVDKFQIQIENGEVFIQDKYLEVPKEKSTSPILQEIKKQSLIQN